VLSFGGLGQAVIGTNEWEEGKGPQGGVWGKKRTNEGKGRETTYAGHFSVQLVSNPCTLVEVERLEPASLLLERVDRVGTRPLWTIEFKGFSPQQKNRKVPLWRVEEEKKNTLHSGGYWEGKRGALWSLGIVSLPSVEAGGKKTHGGEKARGGSSQYFFSVGRT